MKKNIKIHRAQIIQSKIAKSQNLIQKKNLKAKRDAITATNIKISQTSLSHFNIITYRAHTIRKESMIAVIQGIKSLQLARGSIIFIHENSV